MFYFSPAPAWTGALQPNEKLNLVDKILENKIKGPESFASRDDEYLYAGSAVYHVSSHVT